MSGWEEESRESCRTHRAPEWSSRVERTRYRSTVEAAANLVDHRSVSDLGETGGRAQPPTPLPLLEDAT